MIDMDALYIHIPFCDHICSYCDFAKEIASQSKRHRYMRMLSCEILSHQGELDDVVSVFIGGGTPSLLEKAELEGLVTSLKQAGVTHIEDFTIEANPADVDQAKADLFKDVGITRVSLGVQSFDDDHLRLLGRNHDEAQVRSAIEALLKAGIENINADMLFAIPEQTMHSLEADLAIIRELPLKHISYYSVIVEEKTPLEKWIREGIISPVDETLEADMYDLVRNSLKKYGYEHYEISNFAKRDHRSLHNTMVWQSEDYLGVGAGAHSKWRGERFFNVRSIKQYTERLERDASPVESVYELEPMRDYLLFGLRLIEGVSLDSFQKRFGTTLFEAYPALKEDLDEGLLKVEKGHMKFTERGIALGNHVFMKL